jgi:hypothetical protein
MDATRHHIFSLRLVGFLAAASVLAFGLVACGGSGPEGTEAPRETTPEETADAANSFDGVWKGTAGMFEISFRIEDNRVVAFAVPDMCGGLGVVIDGRRPLGTGDQFRLRTAMPVTIAPATGQPYEAEQEIDISGRLTSPTTAEGEIAIKLSAPWQVPQSCDYDWSATRQ